MPPTATPPGQAPLRDTSRDGFRNKVEQWLLSGFRPFWAFVNARPWLARRLNKAVINNAVLKVPARPLALSTMSPYTSWPSLTDRTYFARYLGPRAIENLPTIDRVMELFEIGPEGPRNSSRSTLLFPMFAQWVTDGFLMTDEDRRRTRTSHQVDLNQLYGSSPDAALALRQRSEAAGRKGRLKFDPGHDGDWAPRLFDGKGAKKEEFYSIPAPTKLPPNWPADKKASLFAFGGERANANVYTAAINTLFLREHNRLCGIIEAAHPTWDDERIFQTARNVNVVQLIKIVVEEYINHVSPYWFKLVADPSPCYTASWNRENWIPVEFNLLYRWHSLVPESVRWDGETFPITETLFDNRRLLQNGLAAALASATRSRATRIGLFNTCSMLMDVERASIVQGRHNELGSYNDYRELMLYPRVSRFEQISGDPRVIEGLRRVYGGDPDRIEFFVGLLAEDLPPRAGVPPLLGRMVAADAFSHALTNPLLSPHVFNEATFTKEGLDEIGKTSRLEHLVGRNAPPMPPGMRISMEQEDIASFA